MIDFIKHHPWQIIEEGFNPENQEAAESIFSLGNGKMGHRANFEEYYTGKSMQGTYISGIYYPDKTVVGWWKNGYPEYFAKILNAPDWRGIKISIGKQKLDLFTCKISDFKRVLDMKHGYLQKTFIAEFPDGKKIAVESVRFLSIVQDELGVIKYAVTPLNFSGEIDVLTDIDADVKNKDANYGEKFWVEVEKNYLPYPYIITETKKTFFQLCNAINVVFETNGDAFEPSTFKSFEREKYIGQKYRINVVENQTTTIYKYAAITSSLNYTKENLVEPALTILENAENIGFDGLFDEHKNAWEQKWLESDIVIEDDVAAQQAIRFNIFQLNQTYSGKDERLNIGPKGFTGEKYGGVTYWDTEAYCVPFYLSTAEENVAKNLLKYRFKHLPKAIENAQKLGFKNGAALYPMVTINGEECHNEWEITFEEIHRNGAIAFAIFNYIRYSNDTEYLSKFGLEVLIAISRFWAQRVNFSEQKQKFVMLGVTGPNEYENNVNNNWYTLKMASWTLKYTIESLGFVKKNHSVDLKRIIEKTNFNEIDEVGQWEKIIDNMYFPFDEKRNVFLQQDGFLDKELILAENINPKEKPINQHWSWDRILRSCFIKQADVLQGMFFLEDEFDTETIKRHFDFYEPMTVHESSLSASVHSVLASKIGEEKKAYELYLRTARLDLDDYNNEVAEGLHITSMAGTWISFVYGFGGLRIKDGKISFAPFLPNNWKIITFNVLFRGVRLKVQVVKNEIAISNLSDVDAEVLVYDSDFIVHANDDIVIVRNF
ncbi:MAG: glycoside hydrolase family 65 protein [Bacteroidales bacterium]|nr:glycoside hydrolase family 65 protein [Bacteroidales bacterium]